MRRQRPVAVIPARPGRRTRPRRERRPRARRRSRTDASPGSYPQRHVTFPDTLGSCRTLAHPAAGSINPEGLPLQHVRQRRRGVAGARISSGIALLIRERSADRRARRTEVSGYSRAKVETRDHEDGTEHSHRHDESVPHGPTLHRVCCPDIGTRVCSGDDHGHA